MLLLRTDSSVPPDHLRALGSQSDSSELVLCSCSSRFLSLAAKQHSFHYRIIAQSCRFVIWLASRAVMSIWGNVIDIKLIGIGYTGLLDY